MSKIIFDKTLIGVNTAAFHVELSAIKPNLSFDQMIKYYAKAKGESKIEVEKDKKIDREEPAAD